MNTVNCHGPKASGYNWSTLSSLDDPNESVELLSQKLLEMYNDCFPLIAVKTSSRDPPYMSPLVKHLCKIRNKNAETDSDLIRATRRGEINYRGSKGWWDTVQIITGRKTQGTLISKVINPDNINAYFQSINTNDAYEAPEPLEIPDGTHVPRLPCFLFRISRGTRHLQLLGLMKFPTGSGVTMLII